VTEVQNMYITRVREDSDTIPPTLWATGKIEYPEWIMEEDIEILIQFDYHEIEGFNTVVKSKDRYFMMMSIDLE